MDLNDILKLAHVQNLITKKEISKSLKGGNNILAYNNFKNDLL